MVQAAELSALTLGLSSESVERVRALVQAIGCPIQAPDLGVERWLELMQVDKKTEGGQLRFIMLPRIGEARFEAAPEQAVRRVLQKTVAAATVSSEERRVGKECVRTCRSRW